MGFFYILTFLLVGVVLASTLLPLLGCRIERRSDYVLIVLFVVFWPAAWSSVVTIAVAEKFGETRLGKWLNMPLDQK